MVFAGAARVFEHFSTTPRQHDGHIEPHATLVWIDRAETIHVVATNKASFSLRKSDSPRARDSGRTRRDRGRGDRWRFRRQELLHRRAHLVSPRQSNRTAGQRGGAIRRRTGGDESSTRSSDPVTDRDRPERTSPCPRRGRPVRPGRLRFGEAAAPLVAGRLRWSDPGRAVARRYRPVGRTMSPAPPRRRRRAR